MSVIVITRYRPGDRVRILHLAGLHLDGAIGTVDEVGPRSAFVRPDGHHYSVEIYAGEIERAPKERERPL